MHHHNQLHRSGTFPPPFSLLLFLLSTFYFLRDCTIWAISESHDVILVPHGISHLGETGLLSIRTPAPIDGSESNASCVNNDPKISEILRSGEVSHAADVTIFGPWP